MRKALLFAAIGAVVAMALGITLLATTTDACSGAASVQFKVCPQSAAAIGDPDQTSLLYMVRSYQVPLVDTHAPGRLPVSEMLRQPGVSFVKEDGLPIGPAGISMIEVSIGEDFPGQRFLLFPGDNEIVLCAGEGYVDRREIAPGRWDASVQFKICPEVAATITDPNQTSLIYMVEDYHVAIVDNHPPGRLPVGEMLRQPGVSFVKEDGLPIGPAGISIIEASIGEDFPGQRFMLFPGDNEIVLCAGEGYIDRREIAPGRRDASVQFKICPQVAATISDPNQTSLIYMVETYQVALIDSHAPGRLPVTDMLRQPGVSFFKEDGLPVGPAGISIIEAAIGEDFPAQRFMLRPADNEITVCSPTHDD